MRGTNGKRYGRRKAMRTLLRRGGLVLLPFVLATIGGILAYYETYPYRLDVIAGSAVGGLVLGCGIAAFLYRDSTFKSDDDVRRVLSLPVLASVPFMESGHDSAVSRRRWSSLPGRLVGVLGWLAAMSHSTWQS